MLLGYMSNIPLKPNGFAVRKVWHCYFTRIPAEIGDFRNIKVFEDPRNFLQKVSWQVSKGRSPLAQ